MNRFSVVMYTLIVLIGGTGTTLLHAQTTADTSISFQQPDSTDTEIIMEIEPEVDTTETLSTETEEAGAEIEKIPEVIHRVTPEYPLECTKKGIEGNRRILERQNPFRFM